VLSAVTSTEPSGNARERQPLSREADPVSFRVSSPTFVGRVEQLDALSAALDEASDGRATAVIVGGEAGIGKTRLVAEFAGRARTAGALVLTGGCAPIDGGLPYGPILGVLRDAVRQVGDPTAEALLGRLAPGAEARDSERVDPAGSFPALHPSEEWAKARLFESILAWCTTLARSNPLVVVLEDLHWADSVSTELVSFLTRNLADAPVLIVGTYRPEDLGRGHRLRPWLGELGRHPNAAVITLDGLSRDEMSDLIGGILGQEPDWALLDAVWARSQGNAFFAEELTAARRSTSLSAELRGVIMTRVEGLSDVALGVLRLVAVAGTTVEHELLIAASGLEAIVLEDALAEIVDRQILVVTDAATGYRFRHVLLRETVLAALLPGERARLHRQVATVLVARFPGVASPGELAAHWWGAGAWDEALSASLTAAEEACELWAFPEAHAHLERALAALDRRPLGSAGPAIDRSALVTRASEVAYLAGANERAIELIREAVRSTDAVANPTFAAGLFAILGRNLWGVGDSDAAFEAYRHAAGLLPAGEPSVALARILAEEARGLMMMSRLVESEQRSREAIAVAEATGARLEEGHARNTLGVCRTYLGHHDEGIALVREALALAQELDDPDALNRAYGNLGSLLMDIGRLEEAAALVTDSVAKGEELWGVAMEAATSNAATALIRLGRYDEAEALVMPVGARGLGGCAAGPDQTRASIEILRGHFDDAARLLASADERTAGMTDVQQRGSFHLLSAELALEIGDPDGAFEHVQQALALAAGTDDETYRAEMCALGVRCLADARDSRARHPRIDPTTARALAKELTEEALQLVAAPIERGGSVAPRTSAMASLAVAEQSRLHESDPDAWARAARHWEVAGEARFVGYCRWREAEALLEGAGGRARAEEGLQHAWRIVTEIDTVPLRDRIEQLARRARIDLAPSDDAPSHHERIAADLGVTPREVEVLAQLAAGRTDREIAELLFISKKTASVHVSNLLRKLDVANRVEAGRIGQLHGL
jgi:DNA-binding CsgD family transcriptional regulator/tetratricopeptide (TPR) repeat protein